MRDCEHCCNVDLNYINNFGDVFCEIKKDFCSPYSPACRDFCLVNEEDNGCYVINSICEALQLDKDCYYVLMLRDFRDNYLMSDMRYFDLLIEYEIVGPVIGDYILNDINTANLMMDNYISKVVKFLEGKKYNNALALYIEMIYSLLKKYNINNFDIDMSNVKYEDNLDKKKVKSLAKKTKIIYY